MAADKPKSKDIESEPIELTDKQKAFCSQYIIDWNATRAAIAAGYSEKTARQLASETLSKPYIQAYLKQIQADLEKEVGISKAMVLNEHKKLAFTSIAHLHDTWITRKDFEDLTEDQKSCISEITTQIRKVPLGDEGETEIEVEFVKIKLYDRQKSLDALSKLLGYNSAEKVDIKGEIKSKVYHMKPANGDGNNG